MQLTLDTGVYLDAPQVHRDQHIVYTDNQNAICFSNDFSGPKYVTEIQRIDYKSPRLALFQYKLVIVTCKIIIILWGSIIYHEGKGREVETIKKTILDNY